MVSAHKTHNPTTKASDVIMRFVNVFSPFVLDFMMADRVRACMFRISFWEYLAILLDLSKDFAWQNSWSPHHPYD